jgi:methyl-accepting chemotaxis protein
MKTELSQLSMQEQAELASARAAADRSSQMTAALTIGLSAVALTGGTALVVMLVLSVVRPLGLLRRSVRAIMSGDLNTRAEVSGPDEVASLAQVQPDDAWPAGEKG